MWDTADKHVLLVSDGAELHTYAYAPCTIKGATVTKLGPVEISADGEVTMVPKATPIQQGLFPICEKPAPGNNGRNKPNSERIYAGESPPGDERAVRNAVTLGSHEGAITCQVGSGSITSIRCPLYEHKDAGAFPRPTSRAAGGGRRQTPPAGAVPLLSPR
jgi:hypothetical protein